MRAGPAGPMPDGSLIPLAEQDRHGGTRARSARASTSSPRRCPAAGSARTSSRPRSPPVHDEAPRAEDTDWREIVGLYRLLERVSPNPMVTLNHAVAAAMVDGPAAGLDILQPLEARRADGQAPSTGGGARPPPRDGRRDGAGAGGISPGGPADDQPSGTALPGRSGCSPGVSRTATSVAALLKVLGDLSPRPGPSR